MRVEIVDAALAQFHSRGFNAAGVKDITDLAGVPKGSFYNHFASKEALAVVALEKYGETRGFGELANADIEPLVRLRAHFEYLRDEQAGFGYTRGCLMGNFGTEVTDHSELIRTAVQQGFDYWASLIAATLKEAQQTKAIGRTLDPDASARFIIDAWEGALIQARTEQSGAALDTFFTLVFDTLLH